MSSIGKSSSTVSKTSPLDIPLLEYKLEQQSLPYVLEHLNSNKLKTIPNNTKIIKYDLQKFIPFANFNVDLKKESETKYTFMLRSGNYYKTMEIYKVSRHINPELEVFTEDYKKANHYKYKYLYELVLTQKTNFDMDDIDFKANIRANIKKYTDIKTDLDQKKDKVKNNWSAQIKSLYDEKNALINLNKDLYQRRQEHSKKFYASPIDSRNRKQFIEEYRIILTQTNNNKERILEINKELDILERKIHLYLSETYKYYPTSILTIKSLTKDEYDSFLGIKGGYIDEYSSSTLELSNINNKKQYKLEYLDIDDLAQLQSIASYYKDVKDRIKKLSKKHIKKNEIIMNKDLMKELEMI
jgi:hypothetical protein